MIDNFLAVVILNYYASTPLLSVLGSYMLFHLKEAAELGVNEGTSYRVTISDMEFS